MIRRLLVDVTPLRGSAAYRRLWLGTTLSGVGGQMGVFAVALQVYLLTHSSAAVGLVGLVAFVPAVVSGLLGGSLIDAVDRRRLVLITSSLQCLVSAAFAVQAYAGNEHVALLYLLVGVQSLVGAVNAPARATFMPRLLPPEQLPAGAALQMLSMHAGMVVGPSLAGLVTAAGGLRWCYLLDAVTFLAALYGIFRLPPMRPDGGGGRPGPRAVVDGLRFLGRSRVLTGALVSDLNATVLAMPIALFPAINADRFHGSASTLGLLTTAIAVGGIVGSGLSGPLARVQRQGRGMLVAGGVWGAALACFGLVHGLALTLTALAVAGVADVSSVVLRSTMIQVVTPDAYRGRINAAEFVVGASCPQLGSFRAGVVGSLTTPTISVVSGGLACVVGSGVIALSLPAFFRYRSSPDPRRVSVEKRA